MRALALVVAAGLLGACAEVPELRFVDDGLADGSTSPRSVSAGDSADAAPGLGDDGGAATDAAVDAPSDPDAATCAIPPGFKTGKCCGAIPCVGDHCNAGPTCAECAACAGHALCCAGGGGNAVTCVDDPSACD